MGAPRRAKNTDVNQRLIVRDLRKIKGISVAVDHDDIFVGYKGFNYWFEIKSHYAVQKDGQIKPSCIKTSQQKLLDTWKGHYQIVHSIDQILAELGVAVN